MPVGIGQDPVAYIQSLQARIEAAKRSAGVLDGRRQSLKEQYDALLTKAKEQFGVDSLPELEAMVTSMTEELRVAGASLETLLSQYEGLPKP